MLLPIPFRALNAVVELTLSENTKQKEKKPRKFLIGWSNVECEAGFFEMFYCKEITTILPIAV